MRDPRSDQPMPVAPEPDADEGPVSLAREFVLFLRENKKWWLIPLILMFALLTVVLLAVAHAPAVAPFLYTFF